MNQPKANFKRSIKDIADLSGNRGKKIMFAMDSESKPGKCILHFLQCESIEFDDGADFNAMEVATLKAESDRRLDYLADCFTAGADIAIIDCFRALVLVDRALDAGMKVPSVFMDVKFRESVEQIRAIINETIKKHG